MRIAVTGAGGRLGKVVASLAVTEGHTVVAIDRPDVPIPGEGSGVELVTTDVTRYDDLERVVTGCDAIIHLAAFTSPVGRPDHEVHNNNVVANYNVLSCAARLGIARVCLASSVNAIGGAFSRTPRYHYFPLDEAHPAYPEDPYSLSKWIGESQADAVARRDETMTIASLRLHYLAENCQNVVRKVRAHPDAGRRDLWGYTTFQAGARACLLSLTADFTGHEVFYVVAPETCADAPTRELCERHYPDVPITGDLSGHAALYDSSKAEKLLGWSHDG